MKKARILSTLLVLALLLGGLPAQAAGTTLASGSGVEVVLLDWVLFDSGDSPSITLKIRGVNNTDHKVWVDFKDIKVDGVPVITTTRSLAPHTDTGADNPLLYRVWGSDIDHGAGNAAIRTGKTLEMKVVVEDNETHEKLVSEKVTVNLSQSKPTAPPKASSPASSPSRTGSARTAPSYTPASYDFKTLKKGSRGQAVRDLQQRLTDLGYLNDKIDGSFGRNTGTAVMSFCSQNGLYIQGEATPEMQQLLYSSSAEYYVEPWIPMMFGPSYRWENPRYVDLDNGRFYIQVVNRSPDRAIRGYELCFYLTDVWGNRYISPENGIVVTRHTTMQQTIQPGYIVDSLPITIMPWSWTYTVWVGIHKIVFDDGEVREVDEDEIQYFGCVIKK